MMSRPRVWPSVVMSILWQPIRHLTIVAAAAIPAAVSAGSRVEDRQIVHPADVAFGTTVEHLFYLTDEQR